MDRLEEAGRAAVVELAEAHNAELAEAFRAEVQELWDRQEELRRGLEAAAARGHRFAHLWQKDGPSVRQIIRGQAASSCMEVLLLLTGLCNLLMVYRVPAMVSQLRQARSFTWVKLAVFENFTGACHDVIMIAEFVLEAALIFATMTEPMDFALNCVDALASGQGRRTVKLCRLSRAQIKKLFRWSKTKIRDLRSLLGALADMGWSLYTELLRVLCLCLAMPVICVTELLENLVGGSDLFLGASAADICMYICIYTHTYIRLYL